MKIINAKEEHFGAILKYNEDLVHFLSPMDLENLREMDKELLLHKVVVEDDKVLGFLMAFEENANYDNENFLWFRERMEKFIYIDRIVIPDENQGRGIGKLLYDFIFEFGKAEGYDLVTCEIDIKPPNETSLKFHEKMGFKEKGRQVLSGGKKEVSLQAKTL